MSSGLRARSILTSGIVRVQDITSFDDAANCSLGAVDCLLLATRVVNFSDILVREVGMALEDSLSLQNGLEIVCPLPPLCPVWRRL